MKTAYAPDNTRSSIVVILSMAFAAALIAALIGLSDKPDVDTIALTVPQTSGAPAVSDDNFGFDGAGTTGDSGLLDPVEGASSTEDDNAFTAPIPAADETVDPAGDDQAIVIPTVEPTATPEVAAAVEPTAIPAETTEDAAGVVASAPGLPTSTGSAQGSFFTRPDEDEGAVVTQNLITVSFAEDGSGAFQGVLDITYLDGTHILLNMSGDLIWTAATPQVKANLAGAYTFDALIDADDITSDNAELSITSLESGSGSLCTPKCFGFTFEPQTGL